MRNGGLILKGGWAFNAVEIKRENRLHHDIEAEFFEVAHPEGSSLYERSEVLKNVTFIGGASAAKDVCVDIGCGTGFVTGFELSRYRNVVAVDISRKMLGVLKSRFRGFGGLSQVVCDVENLPLRSEVADLVSASSVLHHLPRPFHSLLEMARVLKGGGFLYITREPNDRRFRRFFALLDEEVISRLRRFARSVPVFRRGGGGPRVVKEGLNYSKVDVHYPRGFNLEELLVFLLSNHFEVLSAYSYHWVYPAAGGEFIEDVLSRVNFAIGKVPLSRKLGRYICCVVKKPTGN